MKKSMKKLVTVLMVVAIAVNCGACKSESSGKASVPSGTKENIELIKKSVDDIEDYLRTIDNLAEKYVSEEESDEEQTFAEISQQTAEAIEKVEKYAEKIASSKKDINALPTNVEDENILKTYNAAKKYVADAENLHSIVIELLKFDKAVTDVFTAYETVTPTGTTQLEIAYSNYTIMKTIVEGLEATECPDYALNAFVECIDQYKNLQECYAQYHDAILANDTVTQVSTNYLYGYLEADRIEAIQQLADRCDEQMEGIRKQIKDEAKVLQNEIMTNCDKVLEVI